MKTFKFGGFQNVVYNIVVKNSQALWQFDVVVVSVECVWIYMHSFNCKKQLPSCDASSLCLRVGGPLWHT